MLAQLVSCCWETEYNLAKSKTTAVDQWWPPCAARACAACASQTHFTLYITQYFILCQDFDEKLQPNCRDWQASWLHDPCPGC